MGRKNRKRFEWVPYLCIAAGLLCMLYPYCSEYIFQNRTASVISTYERASMALEESQHQEMLEQAQRYNILLYSSIDPKAVEPMGIRAFSDVEALLEAARLPGKTVYVIPNGATVIPHIVKEASANEA